MIGHEHKIIVTISNKEISFEDFCNKQGARIINLLNMLEQTCNISAHEIENVRHEILNIGNFTRRMPTVIKVVDLENDN